MLTKLTLTNFQKHNEIIAEFSSNGLIIICGKNWAGKTTLFRGILFALYGPSAVPGGARATQQWGNSTKPTVELEFVLGDADYYRIRRSASVTRLWRNDKMIANGTRPVNDSIKELLGMDPQTFATLKVSAQDEAGSILTLGADKLGSLINQVTGVDLVDKVVERALHARAAAQSQMEVLPAEEVQPLKDRLQVLVTGLKEDSDALGKLHSDLEQVAQKVQSKQQAVEGLWQRWQKAEHSRQALNRLEGKLHTLQEQLNRPAVEEPAGCDLMQMDKAVSDLQAQYDREVSRGTVCQQLENEFSKAEELLSDLFTQRENLFEKVPEPAPNPQDLDLCVQQTAETNRQLIEAKAKLNQLRELRQNAACPTCNRPFEGENPKELNRRVGMAASEVGELKEEYARGLEKGERLRDNLAVLKAYEDLNTQVTEQTSKLSELEQALKTHQPVDAVSFTQLEDSLEDAKEALRAAEKQWEAYNQDSLYRDQLRKNIEDGTSQLLPLQKAADSVSEQALSSARTDLRQLETYHRELSDNYTRQRDYYTTRYQEYHNLKIRYEAALKVSEKMGSLKKRHQLCTQLCKYLRVNRDRFTQEVWDTLLVQASSFAQLATEGQIQGVSRTPEGVFEYLEEGRQMPIVAASGIQRAILGVAVRISIAEALRSPVDFLLLDEITAGATDEISLAVSRTLGLTKQQVLLITHRQGDAAAADSLISL